MISPDDHLIHATTLGLQSTLMVCEGWSALQFCSTGIEVLGKADFGAIFMSSVANCRNNKKTTEDNKKSYANLINALGLKFGSNDFSKLNYGTLWLCFDQDDFGIFNAGLTLGTFTKEWPALWSSNFKIKMLRTPTTIDNRTTTCKHRITQ